MNTLARLWAHLVLWLYAVCLEEGTRQLALPKATMDSWDQSQLVWSDFLWSSRQHWTTPNFCISSLRPTCRTKVRPVTLAASSSALEETHCSNKQGFIRAAAARKPLTHQSPENPASTTSYGMVQLVVLEFKLFSGKCNQRIPANDPQSSRIGGGGLGGTSTQLLTG